MRYFTLPSLHKHHALRSVCLFIPLMLTVLLLSGCEEDNDNETPVIKILESRPLKPTDVNLFSPVAYPEATPMVPATGTPPTETQVRHLLEAYLEEGKQDVSQGLALFEDPALISKVPNPSLRAGLIGLMGTAGEPAIDFVLNAKTEVGLPKTATIGFSNSPWDPNNTTIGMGTLLATDQLVFTFNPKLQAENPFLFTPWIAHEVLHSDIHNAGFEEIINKTIESSIYLEQLALHPELASIGTELARRNNTNALTRLNSGEGATIGLFQSNGDKPILPGSPLTFTSWYAQFPTSDLNETPGNEVLLQMLALMAPGAQLPAEVNFSMATLEFMDQHQTNLSEVELTKAAHALKLEAQ